MARYNNENDSTVFVVPRSPQDATSSSSTVIPLLPELKSEDPSSWPVIDLSDSPPDSVESSEQNSSPSSSAFVSNPNSSPPSLGENLIDCDPAPEKGPIQFWLHAKDDELTDNETCEQVMKERDLCTDNEGFLK